MKLFQPFILIYILMLSVSIDGSSQRSTVDSLFEVTRNLEGYDLAFANLYLAQALISIDSDSAELYIKIAEDYNSNHYNKNIDAFSLKLRGLIAEENAEYELSMAHRRRSYELFKELGDLNEMGWTSRGIGTLYYILGNYEKATEYFILSLSAFEQDNNKRGIADIYNLLGAVNYATGHAKKALDYYTSSIDVFNEIGENIVVSKVYNNIGLIKFDEEEHSEALKYYENALQGFKLSDNQEAICGTLGNMSLCYFKLGQVDTALDYIHKSRRLAIINESLIDEISAYVNIGAFYTEIMQLDSAQIYLDKAILMLERNNIMPLLEEAYNELSKLYSSKEDYKNAYEYRLKFFEVHQNLHEEQSEARIDMLMNSYEQTLRQNEIEQLTLDQLTRSRINKVFGALVIVTIILLFIMVYGYTTIKKKSSLLEEKNNELRLFNQKMIDSEDALKKVIEDKDNLFTIIAHDLRNPVAAVSGFSELLYDNYNQLDVGTRKEYVSQIIQGSIRTYELLENLLLWARSQIDSIAIRKTESNIHKLIEDSVVGVQSNIQRKEIKLAITVDCSFDIFADYDMLKAVIRNLVTNAVKFSFPGSGITVKCYISDNMYHISISDQGIGMEPEIVKGLFTQRIGTTTPGTAGESGSGLGLMICKDYIERHSGSLDVSSQPGKGSTFTVSLPLKEATS